MCCGHVACPKHRYASFDYEPAEYRPADLQRLDVLAHGKVVDALSRLVHKVSVAQPCACAQGALDARDALRGARADGGSLTRAPWVAQDEIASVGRSLIAKLKSLLDRQQFEVVLQASANGRVVARETIKAMRKVCACGCSWGVGGGGGGGGGGALHAEAALRFFSC